MSRDDALTLQETPDVPHDTQDPPAYHAKLGFASFEQYTEAPRTTDGDAGTYSEQLTQYATLD